MTTVTVHQAKTHLSRLLQRVAAGEEVLITRRGTPVGRLMPAVSRAKRRRLGLDRGKVVIADDFDAPLPEEIVASFEA